MALTWLGDHTAGRGRVYVVEARLPETEGRRAMRTYLAEALRKKPLPGLDPAVLRA
ncbi:hypothetical protein ACFWNN_01350 [Lentzea sp. NPDC058450]|uniref:hypothetical protein n=1 Tax=Lentzea sp. NPDC058450 TaxID=3346505 RepID=UPI00364CFCDA